MFESKAQMVFSLDAGVVPSWKLGCIKNMLNRAIP